VVPADGTPVTISRAPECRNNTLSDCTGTVRDQQAVVRLFIEPASRERNIIITTCPQRTDLVRAAVDTVIAAASVSNDGNCSLTTLGCSTCPQL
jgi:hypothetical protein